MGTLTAERWRQVQDVLDRFDDLPPAEKPGLLDETRRDDPDLCDQVQAFLEYDDRLDHFLEKPLVPLGSENIDDGVLVPRIGAYRLARELGEGGMGTVYLAHQEEPFKRRVALKLIRPEILHPDTVRRFAEEQQILAGIRHPNVAQLYDGGTTLDGRPYFVMEYVEGKPIGEYCDEQRLTTRQRLELFLQVCSAVHLAHQKLRVVHRDLKPGNILVTGEGIPKLLDFGIAKPLDVERSSGAVGESLDTVGEDSRPLASGLTPFYSSPEQLAGQPLTTASDIYSLGVLLYQLLTGRLPYRLESSELEAIRAVIERQQPEAPSVAVLRVESNAESVAARLTPEEISRVRDGSPRRLRRRLAGDLDAIVLKAMARRPEDRFASVDQLAADIRRHLTGMPVEARKPTLAHRAGKFVRRHWLPVAAAAVLVFQGGVMVWDQAQEIKQSRRVSESLLGLLKALQPATPDQRVELEEALNRAARIVSDPLFADHPLDQALLMDSLGRGYTALGRYERASALLERALEVRLENLGEDHVLVAESLHNLAFLDQHTGETERAEERLRESLRIRAKSSGLDAGGIAESINTLAITAYDRGLYAEAQALFSRVVDMRTRSLGEEHPDVVLARNNLATVLLEQGDYGAAEEVYRRSLEIRLASVGPMHKNVANSRNQLATVLYAQGRLGLAEDEARQALRIRRAVYGSEHRNVAVVLNNLGKILHGRGALEAAESAYLEALSIYREQLEDGHYEVALTKINLAVTLIAKDDPEAARTLASEAIATLRASQRAESWRMADAESVHAASLARMGRYAEAEAPLERSFEVIREARGENAPYTRAAACRLVELYESWDKPELGEVYLAVAARSPGGRC